jgi:hypothetical protein
MGPGTLGAMPTGAPANQPSGLAPGRNWTWPLNRSPFAMFQKAICDVPKGKKPRPAPRDRGFRDPAP